MYIKQTHSTNALLREMLRSDNLPEGFVLQADFQTAGKGQTGNSWESEEGKNLLFSLLLQPHHIQIEEQFILSQIVSVAIVHVLSRYSSGFSIKWPNDIYFENKKIAGILIENSIQNGKIKATIVGIGLNINQKKFISNAPNPVSLCQITGKRHVRNSVLSLIINEIMKLYLSADFETIRMEYATNLYRKNGFYAFSDGEETFEAAITAVHPDGKLELKTREGRTREFYFKEVSFLNH